ncbi:helix-turn-helix transcriptional regulator [Lactobacillus sp. PV037]|uniref:helix-turn-helix domain-containing protein n=1 Tax=unclassified Lactobacillus TaxID=2620435 RepID=UPI00223FD607|nr:MULTISPECIES: helix-turn-helix transcriptional regulator [unclassified Lactobacillus]QNQ81645.1 helix-turn-helix transcriptional regulator [Lactobacillus sp. PV012]QNQ84308.1 helix-turn-helix transcriptional regulator [Lactobacillus sp. PV037]
MIEFERTKELAKLRNITLRELNTRAGFGTNSIYNWKTKKPGSHALAAVAKILNTSLDYLTGATDDPRPSGMNSNKDLTWADFGMPYGGIIPDDFKNTMQTFAKVYLEEHPELKKKKLN